MSRYGLTVDQAVPQLMQASQIEDEAERRKEFRRIAGEVRSRGYSDGGDDVRYDD